MAPPSQRSEPKAAQSLHGHDAFGARRDGMGGTKDIPSMAAEAGVKALRPALHGELGRLRIDRATWRLALRYADGDRDLAEDALQDACWAILCVKNPERIDNLEAYFHTVLKRTVADHRGHMRRAPVPADNLETLTADVDRGGVTADPEPCRPADARALSNVLAGSWLRRLRRDRYQLRAMLPDSSGNPGRYRDVVARTAEEVLRSLVVGSISWADCNDRLKDAYPEWFDEPGCKQNTRDRRLSRARDDVRTVLKAVVAPDDLRP